MTKRLGPKTILDDKKLKLLFPAMMVAPQLKYITYALGVSKPDTIRSWIAKGMALQENFSEQLSDLEDIAPFEFEKVFENRKIEFEDEFKRMYEIDLDAKIPDRLYNTYYNYMENERKKFIEKNVQRKENEILDDIVLVKDEETNDEYIRCIKFARIYNRGICSVEMGYLSNVNKHASSSKNVGLSLKLLERMNPMDFGEKQQVQHTGTIEVNSKNILSMALNYERETRERLEQKNKQLIDVTPIPQIEQKEIIQKDGI